MLLKTKDLREQSSDELNEELAKLRKELFTTRMELYSRQSEDVSKLGHLRKSISRILTVLRERDLGLQEEVEG